MKEILLSFFVFVTCVTIAIVSQVFYPTSTNASQSIDYENSEALVTSVSKKINSPLEIDPDEINPSLFIMASDKSPEQRSTTSSMETNKETTTSSGLKITDLTLGEGDSANPGQKVTVNYRGTLESGVEFDSSYGRAPFSFNLGAGQVIKGWDEGVSGMKIGGKRKLVIPPELGYGKRGAGNVIPPDATLIFEVELLKIN